jgi:hypothetical protein
MRFCLSRSLIVDVARRFGNQYPADKYASGSGHGAARAKLESLDPATATAAQVAEIIGNKSWSYFACSECSQYVEQAVEFGDGYEACLTLCPSCLRAGSALASVVLPS